MEWSPKIHWIGVEWHCHLEPLFEQEKNPCWHYSTKQIDEHWMALLTWNGKFIEFGHQEALITEEHWCAAFVIARSNENTNRSHGRSTRGIVNVDVVREISVLQVRESSVYVTTRNEVESARQIDISLLPECLECICRSVVWLQLHIRHLNALEVQLLRCVLQLICKHFLTFNYFHARI